jgi:hypothetical protein
MTEQSNAAEAGVRCFADGLAWGADPGLGTCRMGCDYRGTHY